jgi:acetyl-CoA carboxylase biotin carboxyl carrier protein
MLYILKLPMKNLDDMTVQQLLELFESSSLTELEVTSGEDSIRFARMGEVKPVVQVQSSSSVEVDDATEVITSPIVGTFYLTPAPDAPPYVRVGSTVKEEDTLCTIEAMKLMNNLEAEFSCEIVEILAKPEKMVEFGQPLFKVKRL